MDNLTNTNNDTYHRIIYENEICVITEHVNYIKVLFIKEIIDDNNDDFSKIVDFIKESQIEKLLIFDCKNIVRFGDVIIGKIVLINHLIENINNKKIIICNQNPKFIDKFRLYRIDKLLYLYSTFEEAVEYINKTS
jgi:anti-anti-sigma regulatory factor